MMILIHSRPWVTFETAIHAHSVGVISMTE